MTTIDSFKSLEKAIDNGEKTIKCTLPRFLAAFAVAEKCEGKPDNIKQFLSLLLNKQGRDASHYSELYIPILNDKGKTYRIRLSISSCADALKVMAVLQDKNILCKVGRDDKGAMTGEVLFFLNERLSPEYQQ